MSKALRELKEYVEMVDNDILLKREEFKQEKENLNQWKIKFKDFVLDIIKTIAEYSLFTTDEEKEKYDYDTQEQRQKIAEDFINEYMPVIRDSGIDYLLDDFFKIYISEKEEIYEEFLQVPLDQIRKSYECSCLEEEVVYLILDNVANVYAKYKIKISSSKVIKMITMHYKMDKKFKEMNSPFVTDEERKYLLRIKDQNILDMLKEYKKFVEGIDLTGQKDINQLVYAQMLLKENFLKLK